MWGTNDKFTALNSVVTRKEVFNITKVKPQFFLCLLIVWQIHLMVFTVNFCIMCKLVNFVYVV